jgi:hypothetical protein
VIDRAVFGELVVVDAALDVVAGVIACSGCITAVEGEVLGSGGTGIGQE